MALKRELPALNWLRYLYVTRGKGVFPCSQIINLSAQALKEYSGHKHETTNNEEKTITQTRTVPCPGLNCSHFLSDIWVYRSQSGCTVL